MHQRGPGLRHTEQVEAGLADRIGEAVPGQRRYDDVEGVRRVAAVGARIGQRTDHLGELDRRAGPAVREDQRQGVGLRRAYVEEVDRLPVDLRRELRNLVQGRFLRPPVEPGGPVLGEPLEVVDRNAAASTHWQPRWSRSPRKP